MPFKSKKRTIVGTTIQRVSEEDQIVDPFKLAVFESTFSGIDLVDNLLETSLTALPVKATRLYNFTKNNHPGRQLSGEVILDTRFSDAAENHIRSLYPAAVVNFHYTRFGPANAYHEAWKKLIEEYGYDTTTGIINGLSTTNVQSNLVSIGVELPESMRNSLIPWETDNWVLNDSLSTAGLLSFFGLLVPSFNSVPVKFGSVPAPRFRVKYLREVTIPRPGPFLPSKEITEEEFIVPLVLFGGEPLYYNVSFSVGNQRYFWMYEFGSGGVALLDNVLETEIPAQKVGQFFPNIYFRLNKTAVDATVERQFSKRIGLNFNELRDGINQNPDISDVDLAAFNLAIDANSSSQIEQRYLFDFFSQLQRRETNSVWDIENYLFFQLGTREGFRNGRVERKALALKDDFFRSALTYEAITRKTHAGSIGSVNFAQSGKGSESRSRQETSFNKFTGQETLVTTSFSIPYRWYRKQISLSFWEEIRVYDLAMVYWVAGDMRTTLGDEDEEICLVPIDRSIVRTYGVAQQQELYTRGFHFVFNSIQIQKTKWYQRGLFKALLVIVAIVITIKTFGAGAKALGAAFAVGGAAAVIALIVKQVVIALVMQVGLKIFVKLVGPEFAFIAALAAMALGYFGFDFAGVTPDQLLNLGVAGFEQISSAVQGNFADLQKEMESFLSLKSEAEEELERITALLNPRVNPTAQILLGETPGEFFYRTTVVSSSGFTRLNDVSDYVERALYLPTTPAHFNLIE